MKPQRAPRQVGGPGWNAWRGLVGVAYLAAAVFNSVYTLPRSSELDGYAEGAWFPFLESFMRDFFMPNGEPLMLAIIAFEIAVGLFILARGVFVDIGVLASVLWVLAVLPFLPWPYLLTNLALAGAQGTIALRRYDITTWDLVREALVSRRGPRPT